MLEYPKMKLTQACPVCNKPLVLTESTPLGTDELLQAYKCGHAFIRPVAQVTELAISSVDGSKLLRDYQREGVEFIIKSDFNCIIGDQMRLGKTPQSLMALRNALSERTPCLIIVRSANMWQWVREVRDWVAAENTSVFPIIGTKNWIPPGFTTYIISMDTFSRKGMMEALQSFGFKLCIVDEAHSFKNTDSKRSQALIAFLKNINRADLVHIVPFTCMLCKNTWEETVTVTVQTGEATQSVSKSSHCPKCLAQVRQSAAAHVKTRRTCGAVLLSGTAIKNNVEELFVPLNIVAPERYPSKVGFRRQYGIESDRFPRWALNVFKRDTQDIMLRREWSDVYSDLPPINRMFTVIEPSKDALAEQYNKMLDKLEEKLAHKVNPSYWDMADDLMVLRQICGLMKVMWTADYIDVALDDDEDSRHAIGIHHHAVRDLLAYKLGEGRTLKLSGEDSAERKDWIMRSFENSPERVLIVNMLAGGVGMDFHYCHNVLILERQWSSADEAQFEARFYNPDRSIQGDATTNIEYVIAKGTIDEWFYNLVERKRRIFGETLSNNWSMTTDVSSFKDLLNQTLAGRLR